MQKIDFVITWVDGNDPKWQKEKESYMDGKYKKMNQADRYRDWENLKYWFRAVEENTPWVNKIYFITEGHLPEWLNTDYEKLVVIKHSDYINEAYLPTFNSNVIELNIHKISGLSDLFVNFNDDMFVNKPLSPDDFFDEELPRDTGIFSPIVPTRGTISSIVTNNIEVINDYFSSRSVLKNYFFKFFKLQYGKHLIKNFCVLPWKPILGFYDSHIPVSYNKAFFNEVWKREKDLLEEISSHKFRQKNDINHWLIRYWQLCTGNFAPRSTSFGQYYNISDEIDAIESEISSPKYGVICLNDGNIKDFEGDKKRLISIFDRRYPNKSKFER